MFQVCDVRWSDNEVFIAMKGDLDHGAILACSVRISEGWYACYRSSSTCSTWTCPIRRGRVSCSGSPTTRANADKEIVIEGAPDSLRRMLKIARFDRRHAERSRTVAAPGQAHSPRTRRTATTTWSARPVAWLFAPEPRRDLDTTHDRRGT